MQTALLLIDVQQSFKHRPYWRPEPAAAFLHEVNTLVAGCVERGVPIVRILHCDEPAHPDNPFSRESGLLRPMDGLRDFTPALDVVKHRHSALVGTGLMIWLHQQRIGRVIVAGLRSEQCCETTARHASDEGFDVDYVGAATLTFDMETPDGGVMTAPELLARTECVLAGRFVTLCSVGQALARAR